MSEMSRCLADAPSFSPLSLSQDYATAHEDFQQSLELNRNQPIAMLYKGLTFFHRGLLKVNAACVACAVCGGEDAVELSLAQTGS